MLGKVYDFGKQLLSLSRDTQQNKEDIKALREEVRESRREIAEMRQAMTQMQREANQTRLEFAELTRVVERLAFELQRTRERAEDSQKMLLLEMDNRLLRYGRGLPPGDEDAKPEEQEEDY